jgi:hypothetical protein
MMNDMPPKIEFYRTRNFSEKLNVTFQFIRENWKPLLRFTVYLLLPVCLIQTLVMNTVYRNLLSFGRKNGAALAGGDAAFFVNYGFLFLCMIIGGTVLSAMIYALMQTYERREGGLAGVRWSDFRQQLIQNAKRWLALFFYVLAMFVALFVILIVISAAISRGAPLSPFYIMFVILIFIFLALAATIVASLLYPVYIFEPETSLFDATGKAWRYVISDFWSLLGFLIVISIITSVLQTVTTMPWYIVTLIGSLFSMNSSDPVITQSAVYKFSVYILGIIQTMGSYISSVILLTGIAFHYFHLREKHEGVTIESNITNFDELQ